MGDAQSYRTSLHQALQLHVDQGFQILNKVKTLEESLDLQRTALVEKLECHEAELQRLQEKSQKVRESKAEDERELQELELDFHMKENSIVSEGWQVLISEALNIPVRLVGLRLHGLSETRSICV